VITPLQRAVSDALDPVGNFFSALKDIGSIRAERDQLRRALDQALTDRGTLLSLQERVRQLEELLRLESRLAVPTLGATVIAEGVSNFEWTVTIDRGAEEGVKKNMPVVAPDGLVGHVVKVTGSSAVVELILDPDSGVAARLGLSRATGLLTGNRDQELPLELVDQRVDVEPGELVETAGYQKGLYPPGITIGQVSRVLEDPAALTRQVWVRPSVDFSKLEVVLVLLSR
jgi:rod shape-determining protein MreC